MITYIFLILTSVIYTNVAEVSISNTTVQTNVGMIRGLWDANGDYHMYLGVPYGRVDESFPFGAASRYPAFEDVYEAFEDYARCPQNSEDTTLDCLGMNIFVPGTAQPGSNLPVFFFIHGGGFSLGSGSRQRFHGRFFMKHDIIVITINYRLGPYGFFCLDIPEVPGNQGLKDQLMALRWVNENIYGFGGDPNQVFISGESAGGMAADTHLFSSPEKLFKGIIPMSGTAFIPEIASDHDVHAPIKLAAALGLDTDDVYEALSFLATLNPATVISALPNIDRLYPCVEKKFENVEIFLADHPLYINPSEASNISMLIGFNSHECIECGGGKGPDFHATLISDKLELAFNFDRETHLEAEQLMKHFYIGDNEANASQFEGIAKFESDYKFNYPAFRSIRRYLENRANNVYFYMFSYDGGRNVNKITFNVDYPGAVHSDGLGYLFHFESFDLPDPPLEEDQLMIDRMTTMWTNFMKYGDPTPETSELLPVKWEPISSLDSPYFYLNIDSDMELGMRPYHARMAFWDLFYKHNKQFLKGYRDENSTNSASNVFASVFILKFSVFYYLFSQTNKI